MNTNKLKAYAPKARVAFMEAVKNRAAKLGIFEDRISEITIDGDSAIIEKEVYTRKQGQQRNQLVKRIEALGTHDGKFNHKDGYNQFINETAFTWFNRLTAIRYMEVNEYLDHGFRVLSKAEDAQFGEGFEILNSAADVADDLCLDKEQIIDMVLDGNKEEELYRTLLLGQCHQLSEAMPFMFEKLDDATELLLPDNLTKTDSILKPLIDDLPEFEVEWTNIEIIGWLYQFYISEQKDAVMGKVVKREDIPAATQLFTPNWIVKYLVQNSLGRQWLATYPDSELKDKMAYYITPAEQSDDVIEQLKAITPTSIDPEEIRALDPACGSGHILVEVYEVLREIYLERGYRLREIPELILTKNIYGLDIDDRAAQMAAFAVLMKAREDDKRIFTRDIKLNINSVQSTENLNINQLWADLDLDGSKQAGSMGDLFADPQLELAEPTAENKVYLDLLHYLKEQFIDAKSLGSLTEIDNSQLKALIQLEEKLTDKTQNNEPTSKQAAETLLPVIEQSIILANKYDVAVANPPYMGSKGMNITLKSFAKSFYPNSKSDLFAMFMERVFDFLKEDGYNAQVNMQSWMFLAGHENIRKWILDNTIIENMAHLGSKAFKEITGEIVQTTAFIMRLRSISSYKAKYLKLNKGNYLDKISSFKDKKLHFSHLAQSDFNKLPGSPIAYWLSEEFINIFSMDSVRSYAISNGQNKTADNDKYVRQFWEIEHPNIGVEKKWLPYAKGGSFRKWAGNLDTVVDWSLTARQHYRKDQRCRIIPDELWYKQGITWSRVSSDSTPTGFRYLPTGSTFDMVGSSVFIEDSDELFFIMSVLNSCVSKPVLDVLNPSVDIQVRDILNFPLPRNIDKDNVIKNTREIFQITEDDWDSQETSLNFKYHPIPLTHGNLKLHIGKYLTICKERQSRVRELEFNNNGVISTAFNLTGQLDLEVPRSQVTLSNNSSYVFSGEYPSKMISSLVSSLLSYFCGCIMGRYSLDRESLVYAHSGNNGFKELVEEGAYQTFLADDDGIVPLADEEWLFEDDATARFREFVKTVWGEEHLQENLDFVAESLCLDAIKAKKGESSTETIRRYFSMQFYKDHLKTYKKRPIYWLFSSGKAKAFECLVYLHRYNEGTLSRMRTEYVTPLMGKLESRKNILNDSKATASGAEQRAIDKELRTIDKKQAELVKFDEELKHLAEMKISLDLDDGVKVNYGKFGNLLADVKVIHGKKPEMIK